MLKMKKSKSKITNASSIWDHHKTFGVTGNSALNLSSIVCPKQLIVGGRIFSQESIHFDQQPKFRAISRIKIFIIDTKFQQKVEHLHNSVCIVKLVRSMVMSLRQNQSRVRSGFTTFDFNQINGTRNFPPNFCSKFGTHIWCTYSMLPYLVHFRHNLTR